MDSDLTQAEVEALRATYCDALPRRKWIHEFGRHTLQNLISRDIARVNIQGRVILSPAGRAVVEAVERGEE